MNDSPPTLRRPPVLALLYLGATLVLDYLLPTPQLVPWPYQLAGLVPAAAGFSLTHGARRELDRKGTTRNPFGEPTTLVTEGPFRFTRNPMYLAVTIVLLGIAVLVGRAPVFLAPAAFWLTMQLAYVPREEQKLERLLGTAYLDYQRRVRRWV